MINRTFLRPLTVSDNLPKVLYVPYGNHQTRLMFEIARRSRFSGYLLAPRNWDFRDPLDSDGVTVFLDALDVTAMLPFFSTVVTSFSFPHRLLPDEVLHILKAARESGIPIIDVPHGLFQPGRNIIDTSSIVDFASSQFGIPEIVPSFADYLLNWSGPDGIGYPRYPAQHNDERSVVPSYTVITTNTNWYAYTHADRRTLFHELFAFIESRPDQLFIWSPHQVENSTSQFAHWAMKRRPINCLIYGLSADIFFDGIETTEDLIRYARDGITTLSTCILDYEGFNKPTFVYHCESYTELLNTMDRVSVFRNRHDLAGTSEIPKTGQLKPFDAARFDEVLVKVSQQGVPQLRRRPVVEAWNDSGGSRAQGWS